MTEWEWHQETVPKLMLSCLHEKFGLKYRVLSWFGLGDRTGFERKLRLFYCACCRLIWEFIPDGDLRAALECAEQFADQTASRGELDTAQAKVRAFISSNERKLTNPNVEQVVGSRNGALWDAVLMGLPLDGDGETA